MDTFLTLISLVRPRFTDAKIKSFMVVRAGNSARFNINFEVIKKNQIKRNAELFMKILCISPFIFSHDGKIR